MPNKTSIAIANLLEMYLRGTTLDEKIAWLKHFAKTGEVEGFFPENELRQGALSQLRKLIDHLDENNRKAISAQLLQHFIEQAAVQEQAREETRAVLLELKFDDDGTPLLASELSEYLRLLDGFYHREVSSKEESPNNAPPLTIEKIRKGSPLEMLLAGNATALSVAFMFGGGNLKFSFAGAKVELRIPSFGEGLKSLRDALLKPKSAKPGKRDKSKTKSKPKSKSGKKVA